MRRDDLNQRALAVVTADGSRVAPSLLIDQANRVAAFQPHHITHVMRLFGSDARCSPQVRRRLKHKTWCRLHFAITRVAHPRLRLIATVRSPRYAAVTSLTSLVRIPLSTSRPFGGLSRRISRGAIPVKTVLRIFAVIRSNRPATRASGFAENRISAAPVLSLAF